MNPHHARKRDPFEGTLKGYAVLGPSYLESIKDAIPVELAEFAALLPPGSRVLDVGCAGGRDSKRLDERGFSVVGVDLVEEFLAHARKLVPSAAFIRQDARALKFPAHSFDAIYANAVLLHMLKRDVPGVLKNFFRILKTGGMLCVRVKVGKGRRVAKDRLSANLHRMFSYFEKKEMEGLVRKAGFTVVHSSVRTDDLGRLGVQWLTVFGQKPHDVPPRPRS